MLQVNGLQKDYGSLPVLKNVNLTVPSQENIVILGVSGSGKTTLLHLLGGLDSPTQGEILLDGEDIAFLSEKSRNKIRRYEIGFIYQFHHLLPEFSAIENVALPLYIRRIPLSQALAQAKIYLQKVGLAERLNHLPSELSGGERQRVATARALVTQPKLLLADEPTGNLDRKTAHQLFDLLIEMNKELGTSLIVVTHDLELAQKISKQYYLRDGSLTMS